MTRKSTARTIALGLLLAVTASQADSITTQSGEGADSYVYWYGDTKDNNYGAAQYGIIKNYYGAPLYSKAYLRFDISSALGVGESFDTAELKLNWGGVAGYGHYNVYGLNDLTDGDKAPTSTGWQEMGITWNNAPANNTAGNGMTSDATLLGAFSLSGTEDYTEVTIPLSGLKDFLNADTNGLVTLTVMMSGNWNNSNVLFFKERESGIRSPELEYTTIPEPMTMTVLGMGGVALLRRRRK